MSGRVIRPADVFTTTRGRSVVVGGRITAVRPHGALCFWDLTWDGSTLQLVGPKSMPLRRLDVVTVQGVVAVWVMGFPAHTRPFFVRAGVCR